MRTQCTRSIPYSKLTLTSSEPSVIHDFQSHVSKCVYRYNNAAQRQSAVASPASARGCCPEEVIGNGSLHPRTPSAMQTSYQHRKPVHKAKQQKKPSSTRHHVRNEGIPPQLPPADFAEVVQQHPEPKAA